MWVWEVGVARSSRVRGGEMLGVVERSGVRGYWPYAGTDAAEVAAELVVEKSAAAAADVVHRHRRSSCW